MKTFALAAGLALSLVSWTQPEISLNSVETANHQVAAQTQTNSPAGRVYGPADVMRRVDAYSTYTDYILFEGDERAEVKIIGDGDCDLDLYVYNPDGELVAKDDDDTDYCYVSWIPNYRKSYRIVVKNRSRVYANYTLRTN